MTRRNPLAGSPRYAQALYVSQGTTVDILRVVHAQRDLPRSLQSDI